MFPSRDGKLTASQLLLPVCLVIVVMFTFVVFQSTQVLRDRESLHQAKAQQDKPVEDAQKVQSQFEALALGTKKLASKGNKDAQAIIDRLKQLNITVADTAAPTVGAAMPGTMAPQAAPRAMPRQPAEQAPSSDSP